MLKFSLIKDVLLILIPISIPLLAPWISRRWQEAQRDSEIKTVLIAEISELVMTTVMTVYLSNALHTQERRNSSILEEELNRIYKKWRVDTCVIGSKLHAYFPRTKNKGDIPIHEKWRGFSDRLTKYYESFMYKNGQDLDGELDRGKEGLFQEKARVIEDILGSRITGFGSK